VVTSSGPIARLVRVDLVPRLLPALFALRSFRRLMFRTVSQIAVNYRGSSLSEGRAGSVRGGDRLPWVSAGGTSDIGSDNLSPLTSWIGRCTSTARQPHRSVRCARDADWPCTHFPGSQRRPVQA
jgi:hypothetical protein